jgi:hypothetical protein
LFVALNQKQFENYINILPNLNFRLGIALTQDPHVADVFLHLNDALPLDYLFEQVVAFEPADNWERWQQQGLLDPAFVDDVRGHGALLPGLGQQRERFGVSRSHDREMTMVERRHLRLPEHLGGNDDRRVYEAEREVAVAIEQLTCA